MNINTPDQAYEFFVQEALELLQRLEEGLLTLRREHDRKKIHGLMRAAHSLKGGAGCVDLLAIQTLAHNLENGIKALYREGIVFDLELEELLLKAFDCLRSPLMEQIQTGRFSAEAALSRAKPVCKQLEAKLGHPLEAAERVPEIEMDGDITHFLFTEEVPQGLSRWQSWLTNPQLPQVIANLQSQAEVFATLGEMLNLPGFAAIAQASLKALQVNPQSFLTIGKVALADFKEAQQQVLQGDYNQGGNPSQALLRLTQPRKQAKNNHQLANHKLTEGNGLPTKKSQFAPVSLNEHRKILAASSPAPNQLSPSVRVDIEHLNLINNLVGELVTQDNGYLLNNQQNKSSLDSLKRWFNRFNKLAGQLHKIADNNFNSTSNLAQSNSFNCDEITPLVQTMGEEIAQLKEIIEDKELLQQQSQQISKKRQQTLKKVQRQLQQARMLPVASLLNRFPRMLRGLSTRQQKPIQLKLSGKKNLIDKAILEKLYEPLVHLVRNAFDHGLEHPKIRRSQGKSPRGTITIRATQKGNYTYLQVQDDGRGIDVEQIRRTAIAQNLISYSQAAHMSDEQLYNLLFYHGFSLSAQISELSGRGVGLESVLQQVEAIKGTIYVKSELGKGTTFTLRLPWTLAIRKLLVFRLQGNLYAIPADNIAEIVAVNPKEIEVKEEQPVYQWRGKAVPLVESLLSAYRYPSIPLISRQKTINPWEITQAWQPSGKEMLLLVSQAVDKLVKGKLSNGSGFPETDTIALKIDQLLMEQDLVIKPFGKALRTPPYFYGCTILGDGRLVPVLDGQALLERSQLVDQARSLEQQRLKTKVRGNQIQPIPRTSVPTILVIDDSLTTRQTISSTLQKAGYSVVLANHGKEGLTQLQQYPQIRAIICDVEMPQMNGFEFLSRCRKHFSVDELPVLMLTSRSSKGYRQLAKQLGANDYLTKPFLTQELVSSLSKCLKRG
ncbi:MAG: hybrid sensor histidine kinase/response regulator [Coleofasciculaceae cyanobacterium]